MNFLLKIYIKEVVLFCTQMKGVPDVSLHLWIVPPAVTGLPKCAFINIEICPGSVLHQNNNNFKSCLMLENPLGCNNLTHESLLSEVSI